MPGLARDLGRRRAAVARREEDAAGGVEHRLPPLLGASAVAASRSSQSRRARPATRGLARLARCRVLRLAQRRRSAITAPASAITAATSSAWWKPFTKATGRRVAGRERARRAGRDDRAHDRDAERAADLAHAVQHGRADARLVARHRAHRGRRRRRHRERHPDAAERASPGSSAQKRRVARRCARRAASEPASERPCPPPTSERGPIRSDSRPASGATRMISTVIGRKLAPACDRRVAEHLLHVERDVEEDAEHREADEQHHGVRAGEACGCGRATRSSIGSRWCSSSRTNATSATAAIANATEDPRSTSSRSCSPRSARRSARRGRCADVTQPGHVGPLLVRGVARLVDEEERGDDRRACRPGC